MTTQSLSMARRLDFAAKPRKPKDELWLGCVVSEVESVVSKMGYPYVKVRFSNCPYVCIFGAHDGHQLQRLGCEHGRKTRLPEVGDELCVNVYWRFNPRDVLERSLAQNVVKRHKQFGSITVREAYLGEFPEVVGEEEPTHIQQIERKV